MTAFDNRLGMRSETTHDHAGHHAHSAQSGHGHAHDFRGAGKRALWIVLGLLITHLVIEIVGGILAGSLGLLAHATHMITDAVAVCLAIFAMWVAERPATITRTFGFQRAEVLVVMFNAIALWVLASWICYEAYSRLTEHAHGHGHEVEGGIMVAVAIIGLGIHATAAWVLHRSSRHSFNVEGVFWHIIADMLGVVAVLISGIIALFFHWDLVDPILSLFIAALILISSVRLAIRVFRVLLELVPPHLDMYHLCSTLEEVPGVTLIHDVHAWTITPGYEALTAHVLIDPGYSAEQTEPLLRQLRNIIRHDFGVRHVTLQVEQSLDGCAEENHHVGHLAARSHAET